MNYKYTIILSLLLYLLTSCKDGDTNKVETDNIANPSVVNGETDGSENPPDLTSSTNGLSSLSNKVAIGENTIAYVSSSRFRKSIRLIQSDGSKG